MSDWTPIIGLEVHAEMLTGSKMFSACPVVDSVEAAPNTAVDPLSLGMPGTLPVINQLAMEYGLMVGLALNCDIPPFSQFARKSYFYPDLPKGYQISQYEYPLAVNGFIDITLDNGNVKRIGVTRAHMEEDTGKLTHVGHGASLVDYNRAGVPLLEIVSEPDIRSSAEAEAYARKLRAILQYLGVNHGDMSKGILRFEANVSVMHVDDNAFRTRTSTSPSSTPSPEGAAERSGSRLGSSRREGPNVFVFFSSRLGCLGSIAISVVLTLALLLVLGIV